MEVHKRDDGSEYILNDGTFHDPEFLAYKEQLHKFPYYTFLTPEEYEEYEEMNAPRTQMSAAIAKKHPFLWAKYIVGLEPYDYQWKMLNHMYKDKYVVGVTARQRGKSFCIANFAFWAARNNIFPVGTEEKTKIGIMSATEDQAKKLLKEVLSIIQIADANYAEKTKGTSAYQQKKFTSEFKEKPTIFKIEFAKGVIEIFPPTDKIRGQSLSWIIIDEADRMNTDDPDYIFDSVAMPTLDFTNGNAIVFSTPKGTPTYFYNLVRPNNKKPADGWVRIWYPWTIHSDFWERGWLKRKQDIARGKELDFKIEREASFTSGKHTFFHPEAIDAVTYQNLHPEYDFSGPVTAGVDFGDTHSRTVIVIVYHDNYDNTTRTIWHKEFEAGFENSNLPRVMKNLRNRYNIKDVVVDDCVGGKTAIELLRREGWNLKLFNFKRDKHEYYEYTRAAIMNKRVMFYYDPDLIAQLKSIEETVTPMGNTQIKKTKGMNDDISDALVMALSPYTPPKKHTKRYIL